MTKQNKIVKKNKPKRSAKVQKQQKKRPAVRMGPVSTISTAPVAIGNSIRGASSVSTKTAQGVVLRGRDFMFTPVGSGSITTWVTVGGTPITPVAFGDSVLRQYVQMYQKYRWRRLAVHYITSSPTSANGDVMFYHAKNRDSVYLNQTSSFLLPFVISDPDTVIGPQWTNHSTALNVQGTWKSTDYGAVGMPNDYSDGELFLLSKTSTTDSPGYVVFDYEVEFAEMQISPRLLSLPIPRAQYTQLALGVTATAVTSGSTAIQWAAVGNGINGIASALPTGAIRGDIYKIILDVTNSTYTNCTAANLLLSPEFSGSSAGTMTISDGVTLYANYDGTNFALFGSLAAAQANNPTFKYGVTATVTVVQQCLISLISTGYATNIYPNF